jgi:hypothetical protein
MVLKAKDFEFQLRVVSQEASLEDLVAELLLVERLDGTVALSDRLWSGR